jgi:hypothetical protein
MAKGIALALALSLLAGAVCAQGFQRYNQVTSVRVNGRVIAVGDTVRQLRANGPSRVNGSQYVFSDNRVTATCTVGARGTCQFLCVTPKR